MKIHKIRNISLYIYYLKLYNLIIIMKINSFIKLYANKIINPLTINTLYNYNKIKTTNKIVDQSKFLHEELSIRLSHRIFDLLKLPYGLPQDKNIKNIINLYSNSFERIQNISKPTNETTALEFSELINDIKNKHNNLEEDISLGIKNVINNYDENLINFSLINNTLDTFFTSRISIRTLITQNQYFLEEKNMINYCNLKNIIVDSKNDVLQMANLINYNDINIEIVNSDNIIFQYIDSHIYYIVTEILKNSLISHQNNNVKEDIKVQFSEGDKYVIIKISDKGKGFPINKLTKILSYSYSTIPLTNNSDIPNIGGYGFGLPLTNIYCKYFGGYLFVNPVENIGTDVFIYINKLGKENIKIIK